MTFYKWSQTAANNGNADSTCPFPEGMAPSAVNDGTRGMMAAAAKFRDDTAGAVVTTGTLNAYQVASFQVFDSLPDLHGKIIAFAPHVTCGTPVTLNVDALGDKPLRVSPGVDIVEGTLIEGTPYVALYNNTDGVFYLHGFCSSPYNVPFLGGMDFWDTVAPNSAFIFPMGQAISRTVYSKAFARWGTKFGVGDGSTTFNVPDKTGRTSVMIEDSATRLTSTYFGGDSTQIGATGGSEKHALTTAELAVHSHANSLNDPGHAHPVVEAPNIATSVTSAVAAGNGVIGTGTAVESSTTGITINNANAGSGNAHANVQPSIACNYIIRII